MNRKSAPPTRLEQNENIRRECNCPVGIFMPRDGGERATGADARTQFLLRFVSPLPGVFVEIGGKMKSYTKAQLKKFQKSGMKLWKLDTGTLGDDDILAGEKEEVIRDILDYYEETEWPAEWSLTEVDWEI